MFFHYQCDFACREMADIYKKNYKAYATTGNKDGVTYSQINDMLSRKNNKPKSKNYNNGQGTYKKPGHYNKSRNNS